MAALGKNLQCQRFNRRDLPDLGLVSTPALILELSRRYAEYLFIGCRVDGTDRKVDVRHRLCKATVIGGIIARLKLALKN